MGSITHGAMAIDVAVIRGIGTIARTYMSDSREMCANHIAIALQSFKRPVSRRFLSTTLSRSR